ncbi:MAG: uroporphyrinogen-III C-methyltransferase [Candidatus Eutrophobiaceae bacterium]
MDSRDCTIWVTRPSEQAENLVELIEMAGARAVRFSVIEIQALVPVLPPRTADLVVFCSRSAVSCGVALIKKAVSQHCQWVAIGAGTATALREQGCPVVAHGGGQASSESLLENPMLADVCARVVWIVKGEGGCERLAEGLLARGAQVKIIEVYRRIMPTHSFGAFGKLWRKVRPDIVVVSSVEGMTNLLQLCPEELRPALRQTALTVLSRGIAQSARDQGFTGLIEVAPRTSDAGLMQAIHQMGVAMSEDTDKNKVSGQPKGFGSSDPEPSVIEADSTQARSVGFSSWRRGAGIVLLFATLIVLGIGVWWQIERMSPAGNSQEGRELAELHAQLSAHQHWIASLQTQMESAFEEQRIVAESRQQEMAASAYDFELFELEHLLILACHQMELNHDADAALKIMQGVERRAQDLDLPQSILEQWRRDIGALRGATVVDIGGLSLRLMSLMDLVDELPWKRSAYEDSEFEELAADASVWEKIKRDLADMVSIRRRGELADILPNEQVRLREQMKMEFSAARLAALRSDTGTLRHSIDILLKQLQLGFQPDARSVIDLREKLMRIKLLELDTVSLNIRGSVDRYQEWLHSGRGGQG